MLSVISIFTFCAIAAYLISPSKCDAGKVEPDMDALFVKIRKSIDRAEGSQRG